MNKITINGVEIEITDEQANELVEQYKVKQGDWPQNGELYHFVDSSGGLACVHFSGDNFDKWHKSSGNCFRTEKEAEHYRDYLVALNTLKKSSDFVPDWEDLTVYKWYIKFNNVTKRFTACVISCLSDFNIYYRTEIEALAALEKYRSEFEIVYGAAEDKNADK